MTMALILAVARRLVEGANAIHDGAWGGWSPTWMLGRRITGKRLGIVGMGRIGQALARRANAFGLSIHYHNRRRVPVEIEEQLEATYWELLDQMLARVDIVSINCPHTPATYHLLSARRLKHLRSARHIDQHRARRDRRRERAGAHAGDGRTGRRRSRRVRARAGRLAQAAEARQGRQGHAAAAHGLGDDRGPHRHGREGHHQYQRPSWTATGRRTACCRACFKALAAKRTRDPARIDQRTPR